jgi:hypothetical protein
MMLMLCSAAVLAVDTELQPTVEIRQQNLWDKIVSIFSPGALSTSSGPGTTITGQAGDYYSMKFIFSCQADYTQQRFTVDYVDVDQTSLLGKTSGPYTSTIACKKGEWYYVTLSNIQVPTLTSSSCGQLFYVMVKHEGQTTAGWKLDTSPSDSTVPESSLNGFERIALFKYDCAADPCQGLTGTKSGGKYCDGNDVAQRVYTDFVRNGVCYARQDIVQNCVAPGQVCSKGKCILNATETPVTETPVTETPVTEPPVTETPVQNITTTPVTTPLCTETVKLWSATNIIQNDDSCSLNDFCKDSPQLDAFDKKIDCDKYYKHYFLVIWDWIAALFGAA